MKKILGILLIFVLPLTTWAQLQKAEIEGILDGVKDSPDTVYYRYNRGDSLIKGKAPVVNYKYSFNVNVDAPTLLTITKIPQQRLRKKAYAEVFITKGANKIISVDSFYKVQPNSDVQKEFLKFKESMKYYDSAGSYLYGKASQAAVSNDTTQLANYLIKYQRLVKEETEKGYGDYIRNNPTSPIILYLLESYIDGGDVVSIKPIFESLPDEMKNTMVGQKIEQKITVAQALAVGGVAPNFSQQDSTGKTITLSEFRGKYLLIDFWASWCGPCRKENPNLVKAYEKYKSKNFEILGISLDDANDNGREKWLKAIKKDGLTWPQVSDLKAWDNEVAKKYGVSALPQNYLLDPTGKVIAVNLRGKELEAKLEKLLLN